MLDLRTKRFDLYIVNALGHGDNPVSADEFGSKLLGLPRQDCAKEAALALKLAPLLKANQGRSGSCSARYAIRRGWAAPMCQIDIYLDPPLRRGHPT